MSNIGNQIQREIEKAVEAARWHLAGLNAFSLANDEDPFEKLLGFGELIDRLSIVNVKLFALKDRVAKSQDQEKFCAWAAVEDIRLVEERARLKRCLDVKIAKVVARVLAGDRDGGLNPECKLYGDREDGASAEV